ncbi:MAG: nuclear transport factor 2 family protein [Verrucomicrobiota bacterium]
MPVQHQEAPVRVDERQAQLDAIEVRATLLEMTKCLREQDLPGLMGYYVNSPETTVIGSYGKCIRGYDALRQIFAEEFSKQAPTDMTTINSTQVISYGTVALVSANTTRFVKKEDGRTDIQSARFSGVMEKHDGHWKVLQSHFSIPLKFEETGQAKAT